MKTKTHRNVFFIFALLFLFLGINNSMAQYAVGDTVEPFKLFDVDGNFVLSSQYQGEILLLNFFATW